MTVWKQMSKNHAHPLLTWAQALTNRPVREESLAMIFDVELVSPLAQSGIDLKIPPLRGPLHISQQVWINENMGSGTLSLSGTFIVNQT
jgi:hypothetical protein